MQTDDGVVLEAAFPSGAAVVRVGLGRLPRSSLAYATTVHKAQGSEAGTVMFFIDDHQPRLFTREALYTGITRAKGSIVVAGAVRIGRTGPLLGPGPAKRPAHWDAESS